MPLPNGHGTEDEAPRLHSGALVDSELGTAECELVGQPAVVFESAVAALAGSGKVTGLVFSQLCLDFFAFTHLDERCVGAFDSESEKLVNALGRQPNYLSVGTTLAKPSNRVRIEWLPCRESFFRDENLAQLEIRLFAALRLLLDFDPAVWLAV